LYQYNGKELIQDAGLGWHAYGKRYYDAAIGRFPNVDPLIDTFHFVTGYNYAENEPVGHIDLWGLQKQSMIDMAIDKAKTVFNTAYNSMDYKFDLNVQVSAGKQAGITVEVGSVEVGAIANAGSQVLYGQNATVQGLSNAEPNFEQTTYSDNVKTEGSVVALGALGREKSTTTRNGSVTQEIEYQVGPVSQKESKSTGKNGATKSSSDFGFKVGVDLRFIIGLKVEAFIGVTNPPNTQ
jgi:RHS repeat-associated protein